MSKPPSLKAAVQNRTSQHPDAEVTLAAAPGKPETRRLNVNLSADLYARVQAKASAEGHTLAFLVRRWAEGYVTGRSDGG